MKTALPFLIIILGFASFGAYAQEFDHDKYVPSYSLPMPTGWGVERFGFPISFAPSIAYKGVEDVRFTPGWGDPKSNDYWSYAFLWYLDGAVTITPEAMEKNLVAYYSGLIDRNIEPRKIPKEKLFPVKVVLKKIAAANGDAQTYSGTVEMLDYMEQKPITHNCMVHLKSCAGKNNTYLFCQISPKPLTDSVWRGLQDLWTNFNCEADK